MITPIAKVSASTSVTRRPNLDFDKSKITRVEVIDSNGRWYVNMNVSKLELMIQDNGRTLKVFIK